MLPSAQSVYGLFYLAEEDLNQQVRYGRFFHGEMLCHQASQSDGLPQARQRHCAQPAYHRWPQQFPALQAGAAQAANSTGALLVVAENLYGYGPVASLLTEDLPLAASTRKRSVRAQMSSSLEAQHRSGELRFVVAQASDFFGPGVEVSAVGKR